MNIWNQYNEFKENLNKEVKEMVKAIYVKTYGKKPNFVEGETYILDMSDIPYKGDCKIYQKIKCIHIDNDGDIEFKAKSGRVSMVDVSNLMNIYSFLYLVMSEIGLNADSRTAYVEWNENIPTEVEIPFYITDEEVEDYLSDKYGYCVESYTIDNE